MCIDDHGAEGYAAWRYRLAGAAAEPRHAAERADRRPGARARLREPRLPARRRRPHPAAGTTDGAGSPAGSSSRAGTAAPLLQPGRFTELFFLDEATAFAAGHRPCALCRRADYDRFGAIWRELHPGQRGADAIDAQLHARARRSGHARAAPPPRRRSTASPTARSSCATASPGSCSARSCCAWTPAGYDARGPRRRAARPSDHAAVARGGPARRLGAASCRCSTRPPPAIGACRPRV